MCAFDAWRVRGRDSRRAGPRATRFPATTFAINAGVAFALAVLLVLIADVWSPTTYVRPFLCVGFLGAFTTFSTWMVDADRLLAAGDYGTAAANLAGSLGAGAAAASPGLVVAREFGAWQVRRRERIAVQERAAPAEVET